MEKKICYIIDDDKIVHFLTTHLFKLAFPDWMVIPFFNGKEALDAIINESEPPPRLILLDINMPVMDGWEFLEHLNQLQNNNEPQVAMVSSSVDPRDKARISKYPMVTDYLLKPVTKDKIADLVYH